MVEVSKDAVEAVFQALKHYLGRGVAQRAITHRLLADRSGYSRRVVARALDVLEAEGRIERYLIRIKE